MGQRRIIIIWNERDRILTLMTKASQAKKKREGNDLES